MERSLYILFVQDVALPRSTSSTQLREAAMRACILIQAAQRQANGRVKATYGFVHSATASEAVGVAGIDKHAVNPRCLKGFQPPPEILSEFHSTLKQYFACSKNRQGYKEFNKGEARQLPTVV
ncbi:hypothetical protein HaLaN_22868 [Haematococcus lacustris]|uniref:Uncharacterized protein n=1 Tax=Haematococcus lacustris TaxID=44745 RepID=A0A699ZQL4_HAELA|nr:hypothetical protein HaLaN_22868 [Haematococcus lacustris]